MGRSLDLHCVSLIAGMAPGAVIAINLRPWPGFGRSASQAYRHICRSLPFMPLSSEPSHLVATHRISRAWEGGVA
jgi:hypothetical protein